MSRRNRKKVIAFALEQTYSVDAIAAAQPVKHVLARGIEIEPIVGDDVDLDYDNGEGGNSLQLLAGNHVSVKFTVDWAGAGAATTTVPYANLLKACFRSAAPAASDVTYAINEAATDSLTLYFYMDGVLHALTGTRGSFALKANAKALPEIAFTFMGLFQPVATQAVPVPDFTGWQTPELVGVANTAASLAGNAVKLLEFGYDQANDVSYQEYVGHEEVEITDFKPNGTMVIVAATLAGFDPFATALAHTVIPFELTHGSALNQVGWQGSIQLGRPTYGDADGTMTYSLPYRVMGNTDYLFSK